MKIFINMFSPICHRIEMFRLKHEKSFPFIMFLAAIGMFIEEKMGDTSSPLNSLFGQLLFMTMVFYAITIGNFYIGVMVFGNNKPNIKHTVTIATLNPYSWRENKTIQINHIPPTAEDS